MAHVRGCVPASGRADSPLARRGGLGDGAMLRLILLRALSSRGDPISFLPFPQGFAAHCDPL
jgi:hypothetical protein